jgi:hypothetical protein
VIGFSPTYCMGVPVLATLSSLMRPQAEAPLLLSRPPCQTRSRDCTVRLPMKFGVFESAFGTTRGTNNAGLTADHKAATKPKVRNSTVRS